jgi:hypothetical protein
MTIGYRHVTPCQELATELARSLEEKGFAVFMDTKIRIGQEWVDEIDQQLRSSQHFIVLLSAESIRSDMARREIALAHSLRKEKRLTVFPVRVDSSGCYHIIWELIWIRSCTRAGPRVTHLIDLSVHSP